MNLVSDKVIFLIVAPGDNIPHTVLFGVTLDTKNTDLFVCVLFLLYVRKHLGHCVVQFAHLVGGVDYTCLLQFHKQIKIGGFFGAFRR